MGARNHIYSTWMADTAPLYAIEHWRDKDKNLMHQMTNAENKATE